MKAKRTILVLFGSILLFGCHRSKPAAAERLVDPPKLTATALDESRPPIVPNAVPGGALDFDCAHVGAGLGGSGYQFIVTCPGRSQAPNGQWAVVQRSGKDPAVILAGADGKLLDAIPELRDGMPFVIFWSPKSNWFLANHYLGSGQEQLRLFQIVDGKAIERPVIYERAARVTARRYPCLRTSQVAASGWKWSSDGRRVALVAYARPDACFVEGPDGQFRPRGTWEALWMIGDVEAGQIDPASVRIRAKGTASFPTDGPYAEFHR